MSEVPDAEATATAPAVDTRPASDAGITATDPTPY